jgi:flagellar FliL protein
MAEDLEEDFEEHGGGDDAPEGSSKKPPIKKILLIVLPILLLVGAGAGLYFSGILDKLMGGHKTEEHHEEAAHPPEHAGPKVVQAAVFMDLPEMLVNLQTTGRKQAFLKLRVALELEGATDQPRVEQMMPRIVDNFQVYLRELRVEDLQGAAGMHLLREELLTRVNAAVKPVKVNDVLFKEMLVQ